MFASVDHVQAPFGGGIAGCWCAGGCASSGPCWSCSCAAAGGAAAIRQAAAIDTRYWIARLLTLGHRRFVDGRAKLILNHVGRSSPSFVGGLSLARVPDGRCRRRAARVLLPDHAGIRRRRTPLPRTVA